MDSCAVSLKTLAVSKPFCPSERPYLLQPEPLLMTTFLSKSASYLETYFYGLLFCHVLSTGSMCFHPNTALQILDIGFTMIFSQLSDSIDQDQFVACFACETMSLFVLFMFSQFLSTSFKMRLRPITILHHKQNNI